MSTSNMDDDLEEQNIQLSVQRGYDTGNNGTWGSQKRIHASQSKPTRTTSTPIPEYVEEEEEEPEVDETTLKGKFVARLNRSWNMIFIFACVIAVSLDPLFFYIPIINEDRKCLYMDTKLKNAALICRSLMDITFIIHIIYEVREAKKDVDQDPNQRDEQTGAHKSWDDKFFDRIEHVDNIFSKLSWRSFATDILSVLPIPQVLLVVVFFEMRGSGYLNYRKLLNFFLLLQYVARIYRIHLSTHKLEKSAGILVKGLFNFFLYILASHALGAFWYFFSIQRETSCWHRSCGKNNTICASTFYCDKDDIQSKTINDTIAMLQTSCALEKEAQFDFGLFLDALKSGNTVSKAFSEKLLYCFWWGLRNLSNFGTNLNETSNYVWENCFACLISITGLLIFLYLIGNVQTYMQMKTTESEEIRQKIERKEEALKLWMKRHNLPASLKKVIKKNIREKLKEDKDSDLENLFSVISWNTKKNLKRFLCMKALGKVPRLVGMEERVLKMICDYMKPVMYPVGHPFIKMDDPVDRMIFITEGTMWIYTAGGGGSSDGGSQGGNNRAASQTPSPSTIKALEKGAFYGDEQLLSWAAPINNVPNFNLEFKNLKTSTVNVKCHTQVEGFTLSAKDLKAVVRKCKYLWK